MRFFLPLFLLLIFISCAQSQQRSVHRLIGGPCEGCEAVFEYGDRIIQSTDTLPGFDQASEKLRVSGKVYKPDGRTPAEGVILYVYHTNEEGIYPTRGDEKGWARRHGYIRGWIKTDSEGYYSFYTFVPGTYPSRTEPAHIHVTVLEPDGKYYWLGSYHFDRDPLLSDKARNPTTPRGGGNGVLALESSNGILSGERNIILGINIEGYR